MRDFKSHFRQDFFGYCIGQSVCIWQWRTLAACSTVFQSLLSLKQQQNLMKIMFSCIHFPVSIPPPPPPPPPPPKGDFLIFYTGKLYGLTGMLFQYLQNEWETETGLKFNSDDNNRLFMVPHLIRAQRAYRDIRIHLFHQLTHTE